MTETLTAPVIRSLAVVIVTRPRSLVRRRTARARRAVGAFLGSFFALTLSLDVLLAGPWARLRDPEYAARRGRLVARVKEHPHRPVLLVLGSSRTVEGIRPDVIHGETGPIVLNGGLIGSGPVLELLAYRRLKADGIRSAAVLLEYWPPLLRGDIHAEYGRINRPRLGLRDRKIVRDYFPDPDDVMGTVVESQLWPAYRYRRPLMASIRPKWVANARHNARFAAGTDDWGWWAGVQDGDADDVRERCRKLARHPFQHFLEGFSVGSEADRALRTLLDECRADGVNVAFVFMPEGQAFRALYQVDAERNWRTHLEGIVEGYDTPILDARTWDEFAPDLPDEIHLTRGGATRFSRRLAGELPRLFPATFVGRVAAVVP